jgi:hypothetical protein
MGSPTSTKPIHRRSGYERKLAAYLATAGGALLATADKGHADIIYSGPQNIPIGAGQTVNLDLNGDGIVDYQFQNTFVPGGGPVGKDARELNLLLQGSNQAVDSGPSTSPPNSPAALPAGVLIPDSQSLDVTNPLMAGVSTFEGFPFGYGNWSGATDMYLGLQFDIGGQTHFGWAELSVSSGTDITTDPTAVLEGWAYERVAGAPITTGQTSGGVPVPEPSSFLLFALGATGLAIYRRRRQAQTASQTVA